MKRDGKKKLLRLGKEFVPQRCELCGDRKAPTSEIPDPTIEELDDLFTVWACPLCREGVEEERKEEARKKVQLLEVDDFIADAVAAEFIDNPFANVQAVTPRFSRPPSPPTSTELSVSLMTRRIAGRLGISSRDLMETYRNGSGAVIRMLYPFIMRDTAPPTVQEVTTTAPDITMPENQLSSLNMDTLHDAYTTVTRCRPMQSLSRDMLIQSIGSFRAAQEIIPSPLQGDLIVRMSRNTLRNFAEKVQLLLIMNFDPILAEDPSTARALLLWHLNARIPAWRMATVDLRVFTAVELRIFSSAITGDMVPPFAVNSAPEIWRYCMTSLQITNVVISPTIQTVSQLSEHVIRIGEDWELYYWAGIVGVQRSRAHTALGEGVGTLRDLVLTSFQNMES
jgi:hypothetical protein